jgi:hypothetical protein
MANRRCLGRTQQRRRQRRRRRHRQRFIFRLTSEAVTCFVGPVHDRTRRRCPATISDGCNQGYPDRFYVSHPVGLSLQCQTCPNAAQTLSPLIIGAQTATGKSQLAMVARAGRTGGVYCVLSSPANAAVCGVSSRSFPFVFVSSFSSSSSPIIVCVTRRRTSDDAGDARWCRPCAP